MHLMLLSPANMSGGYVRGIMTGYYVRGLRQEIMKMVISLMI